MPGFSVNVINLLAGNLRDGYGNGFPVLKELIQNANDAHANHMVFGHHPGFPEATHPLLKGPAIWFWNDGVFEESDAKGIASFADDTRAGETEAIGKFGLGMKSVFHWCEAFFYIAKANNGDFFSEFINPWNSGESRRPHTDWDSNSTIEWDRLSTFVTETLPRVGEGNFLLWLPLRTHEQLGGKGAIIERYPGEPRSNDLAFLADDHLPFEIANVLTLLPRLRSIRYRADGAGISFTVSSAAAVGADVANSNLLLGQKDVSALPAVGRVSISIPGKNISDIRYSGIRDVGHRGNGLSAPFNDLRASSYWPKTFARDKDWREYQAEDKSQAEGAVIISHRDGSAGHCSIEWAVFLPLGEEMSQTVAIPNSSRHYRITLHGQFFIDGGRKKVNHYPALCRPAESVSPENADTLQKQWNQALAQQIVLPLLLPTLKAYLENHKHDEAEIHDLTNAINRVPHRDGAGIGGATFISQYEAYVCARHAWARVLEQNGPRWNLIDLADGRLLPLPASANEREDPGRAWTVLPGISKIARVTYFDADAPRIARHVDQWTEEDLDAVISSVAIEALRESTALGYFRSFLYKSASHYRGAGRLQDTVLRVIRKVLTRFSLADVRALRREVRKLIGFVLPGRRISVPSPTSEDMLKRLWGCSTETLIVPANLDAADADEKGGAKPSVEEMTTWLVSLTQPGFQPSRTDDLLDLIGSLRRSLPDDDWATLLGRNRTLKVIAAHDARLGKKEAYSFQELEYVLGRGNLFGYSQGTRIEERLGRTGLLAAVLPEEKIEVID
ncbi:MAG: hypothetical protein SGJ20_21850, partial [Planctomycetota bacterium]|nr:hypothetical protein [Planctomycetota bacterium]